MQNQNRNWCCFERQVITTVSTTASSTHFTTTLGIEASDARIINTGANAMNVRFGDSSVTAMNTAGSAGVKEYYLQPSQDIVVEKSQAAYVSAITDSGTSSLVIEAGQGN